MKEDAPNQEHLVEELLPFAFERPDPLFFLPFSERLAFVTRERAADLARLSLDLHADPVVQELTGLRTGRDRQLALRE